MIVNTSANLSQRSRGLNSLPAKAEPASRKRALRVSGNAKHEA
jgi:hypothetical protein